jgi:hypothetical protein
MQVRILLLLMLSIAVAAWAADNDKTLNVKLGLWEVTATGTRSGEMPIPPEALARLPPEKRAKLEENMKAAMAKEPTSTTRKMCVTKEKLQRTPFTDDDKPTCKRTVISSTSSKLEVREQCMDSGGKMDATFTVEALNPESATGVFEMTNSSGDHTMKVSTKMSAKWIGPTCGGVN